MLTAWGRVTALGALSAGLVIRLVARQQAVAQALRRGRPLALARGERYDVVLLDQRRHAIMACERAIFWRGRQREHVHALVAVAPHDIPADTMVDPEPDLFLNSLKGRDHHLARVQVVPFA